MCSPTPSPTPMFTHFGDSIVATMILSLALQTCMLCVLTRAKMPRWQVISQIYGCHLAVSNSSDICLCAVYVCACYLCVCACACMCVLCVCMCVCMCVYVCVCCVCVYVCVCVCCVCMCVCVVCVCMCVYVCVVCVCVCVCVLCVYVCLVCGNWQISDGAAECFRPSLLIPPC